MPTKFQRPALQTTLLALLATGCVATHSPDDASGVDAALSPDAFAAADTSLVDAFVVPDAFVPDAFVCPDGDGDGETDARCGGLDCDDADRNISSTRTHCASPSSVTRCEGAMRVDAACDSATPYCDARTNACVADACGDLVVHANEQCDDGGSRPGSECSDCHRLCGSSVECPASMVCLPFYSNDDAQRMSGCFPAHLGGAPFGARCTTDGECYSGLCSPADGRCTEGASEGAWGYRPPSALCQGPHRWSEHWTYTRDGEGGGGRVDFDSICAFECEHNTECAVGATCVPMQLGVGAEVLMVAGCRTGWVRGSIAQGELCRFDADCLSGVCTFQHCSQLCRTSADCEPGAPNCVAVDRTMPPPEAPLDRWALTARPRPAEWGTPWPTLCVP